MRYPFVRYRAFIRANSTIDVSGNGTKRSKKDDDEKEDGDGGDDDNSDSVDNKSDVQWRKKASKCKLGFICTEGSAFLELGLMEGTVKCKCNSIELMWTKLC